MRSCSHCSPTTPHFPKMERWSGKGGFGRSRKLSFQQHEALDVCLLPSSPRATTTTNRVHKCVVSKKPRIKLPTEWHEVLRGSCGDFGEDKIQLKAREVSLRVTARFFFFFLMRILGLRHQTKTYQNTRFYDDSGGARS